MGSYHGRILIVGGLLCQEDMDFAQLIVVILSSHPKHAVWTHPRYLGAQSVQTLILTGGGPHTMMEA